MKINTEVAAQVGDICYEVTAEGDKIYVYQFQSLYSLGGSKGFTYVEPIPGSIIVIEKEFGEVSIGVYEEDNPDRPLYFLTSQSHTFDALEVAHVIAKWSSLKLDSVDIGNISLKVAVAIGTRPIV